MKEIILVTLYYDLIFYSVSTSRGSEFQGLHILE